MLGLQDDVDDACDRIGAILSSSPVLEHLDAIDRCGRDEIEVGRRATLGGARPSLKICGAVTPLSVHPDQCVVRVEAAKIGRATLREKGGQDGEMQGVGGSVKKKI